MGFFLSQCLAVELFWTRLQPERARQNVTADSIFLP